MESEFAAVVDSWSAFYSAVAGEAATLVGLLFVSLALNPTVMGTTGRRGCVSVPGKRFTAF